MMQYSDGSDENDDDYDDAGDSHHHHHHHGNSNKRRKTTAATGGSPGGGGGASPLDKKQKRHQPRLTTSSTCKMNKDLYSQFETLPDYYVTGSGNVTKCYQCICLYCKKAYNAAVATASASTTATTAAATDAASVDVEPPEVIKRSRRECEAHLTRCKHKQTFAAAAAAASLTTATTCLLMPAAAAAQLPSSTSSNKKHSGAAAATAAMPPPPCTLFFSHAPKSHFAVNNLTVQGSLSAGGTTGQQAAAPTQHASRQLVIQGASSPAAFSTALSKTTVGSWWCSTGTWTVVQPRTSTMVFHVWTGHAQVMDATSGGGDDDETTRQHFFGPGDTVILPKGWSGRWSVQQDIHTIWFDYEHEIDIQLQESASSSPRAIVTPYHEFAPHLLQAQGVLQQPDAAGDCSNGSTPPRIALRIIHDKTPILKVGCWTCTPGSFMIQHHATTECFHVLEGVLFLTNHNAEGMASRRCVAGDTVVIPKGWTGHVDVIQTVKKLWFAVD
jgi:uncharacterized cupin superfamily protein